MGLRVPGEQGLKAGAACVPRAPGPGDRVARPQDIPKALLVAGPQHGPEQQAGEAAADHPGHDDGAVVVEPHQMRRHRPDQVAHRGIVAVHDPGIAGGRGGDAAGEFVRVGDGQGGQPGSQCSASSSTHGQASAAAMAFANVVLPAPGEPITMIRTICFPPVDRASSVARARWDCGRSWPAPRAHWHPEARRELAQKPPADAAFMHDGGRPGRFTSDACIQNLCATTLIPRRNEPHRSRRQHRRQRGNGERCRQRPGQQHPGHSRADRHARPVQAH